MILLKARASETHKNRTYRLIHPSLYAITSKITWKKWIRTRIQNDQTNIIRGQGRG